jgi:oligoribonuclease (3'-5' exoribonuclease)
MEDGNYKLKETMQVKLKAELGKVSKERDKLLEKMKEASDEIHRQKGLIDKMMSGYEYEAAIEL